MKIMITENIDVENGIYNGMQGLIKKSKMILSML